MLRDYRNSAIMVLVGLAASYLVVAGGTFEGTSRRAVIAGALDSLVGSFGRTPVLAVVWVLALVAAWKMWPRRGRNESGPAMAEPVAVKQDDLAVVQSRLQRLDRFKAAERGDVSGVLTRLPEIAAETARQPEPTSDIPAKRPAESPRDEDVSQVVERARRRPIVFRESYPPGVDGGLSFYGGRPVGPGRMSWPRGETKNGEGPLHFMMQWDCAELAAQDPSGLLPCDGALYLFCDLEWGMPLAFRFVHVEGPTSGWAPLAVPHDLGPVYGSQGAWLIKYCSAKVPPEQQGVPRLLPKWPFRPVSFDLPAIDGDGEAEDEEADGRFWQQSEAVKQALLGVQDSLGPPLATFEPGKKAPPFGRPFASFPHDWAAVRRVTVEAIERLQRPEDLGPGFLPEATQEERGETVARWLQEANELHAFAVAQPAEAIVPPQTADDIWAWIESIKPAIRLGFSRLVEESVNASLGLESEARAAIPRELVDANSVQHSLAHAFVREEYPPWGQPEAMEAFKARQERGELATVRDIHSPTPNHMFGPPSYVQGDAEERVQDWLLLLELSNNEAIGQLFGEGVIQFLIRPADLRDRRFEAVEAILSAY